MHPRGPGSAPDEPEERVDAGEPEEGDPILERVVRDRRPGELESGMLSGSDDAEISATGRFEGDVTPAEALEVLDPDHRTHPTRATTPRAED